LIDKLKVEDDKLNQELDDPQGDPFPHAFIIDLKKKGR
jgi:hypothetical protein